MIQWKQWVQKLCRFDVGTTEKNQRGELIDISSILKVESTSNFPHQIDILISTWNFGIESMANRQRCAHWVEILHSKLQNFPEMKAAIEMFAGIYIYIQYIYFSLLQHCRNTYLPTLVTLVSHSHNLFQLILLDHCHKWKQPTQLWTWSKLLIKKPEQLSKSLFIYHDEVLTGFKHNLKEQLSKMFYKKGCS